MQNIDDLFNTEWKGIPDVVVFDYRVHDYTADEVKERLHPNIGRTCRYDQFFPNHRTGLMGVITYESGSYILRGPTGHHIDLSIQLTDAVDQISNEKAYQTIIEVDRTDRYLKIKHGIPSGYNTN